MRRFFVGGLVLLAIGVANMRGALLFPYLDPIRAVIVTNIAGVTNTSDISPQQRQQLRSLLQARKFIDRSGRASLFNDVQVLANVSSALRKGFPEGDFDLLLLDAIAQYQAALIESALTLETNVSLLPPSPVTIAAGNTIDDTLNRLSQIDTTAGISAGNRSLLAAALRLRSVEAALLRPVKPVNRPVQFTAQINGQPFRADSGSGLSTFYNPLSEYVTLTARDVSGVPSTLRTITLSIGDVIPGTTTHTLGSPGSGAYATYSMNGPTNSATFISVSGHAIVRLDPKTGTLSGTFSFEANDSLRLGTVSRVSNGNFSAQLQ